MRLFMQAVSIEERRAVHPSAPPRVTMPRRYRRLVTMLAGAAVGALLGALYLYLMMHARRWDLYLGAAVLGAAGGVALATIPGLIWAFLRKQWYRLQVRQWTDKSQLLATLARRQLQEQPDGGPHFANDSAVVDFLQHDYPHAVEGFSAAAGAGLDEGRANLLATLAETGRWEQVADHLAQETAASPDLGETNLARLSAYVPDETVVERLWQVAQQRRHPVLLNNLGVRAMQGRRLPQAARALELAVEQKPAYAYAHANLGVLAYRRGDLKKAVAETASAATLVAEDDVILSNLGALLAQAQDLRNAERWLHRASALQTRNPGLLVNLGVAHQLSGRTDDAVAVLQTAARLPEVQADADYNLAHVYSAQGDLAGAAEHLEAALAGRPDDPDILNNLGCVLFEQKQFQAAYERFHQVAQLRQEGVYRRNVIRAELGAGRLDEANTLLEKLMNDESVSLERGLLHLLRAAQMKPETETHRQMITFNLKAAAENLTRAIALNQAPMDAALNHGLVQYLRGEYRSAGDTFAQTLKRTPGHLEMHYAAALSYILAGMREREDHPEGSGELPPPVRELYLKARPHLEKATEATALAEVAIYDLGLLNYVLGDYQRAIEVLRRIVRNDSPPHLLNALAITQARHAQELQLTAQTASLMSETRKKEVRAQARQLLASAVYYFKQALQAAPQAPLTHANLGLALMLRNQKGDVEAALYHWQLMHQHGDARARKAYEQFMQAQSPDAAQRLRFQDMELVFRPLKVQEWIVLVPPTMFGPRFIVSELLDVPDWQLQAHHRTVQRSLTYRRKAERTRRKLRRLAI